MSRSRLLLFALLLPALAGCSLLRIDDDERHEALARIAKDWSAVIRASQVVPVYPLTEDLQPGDLFLVQTTVDRQHETWLRRGYLPLDQHLDRLEPAGYERFYAQLPGPAGSAEGGGWRGRQAWERLPLAGFPSYAFRLGKGAGLDLAIPLAAVSVGLSLLGSDEASGSVSLREAYTYGIGSGPLADQVLAWNATGAETRRLAPYASPDGCGASAGAPPCHYLRVVNRVFLVRSVEVGISAARSNEASVAARLSAAGLLGGVGNAVGAAPGAVVRGTAGALDGVGDRLAPKAPPDGAYARALRTLNGALAGERGAAGVLDRVAKPAGRAAGRALGAVGGALPASALPLPQAGLQVRSFSDRTIALSETFARPLAIGYLAFDMKILAGGELGAPVPTLQVADEGRLPPAERARQFDAGFDYATLLDDTLPRCAAADAILSAAVACLGPDWTRAWAGQAETRRKPPGRSGLVTQPSSVFRRIARELEAANRPPVADGLPAHCPPPAGADFQTRVVQLLGPSAAACTLTDPLR